MERVLARDLEEYCSANTTPTSIPPDLQLFFSAAPESISLSKYVERLVEYTGCSDSVFIVALIYLHRAQVARRELALTHTNCHRLFSASLYLASKYVDDIVFDGDHYAAVFGIDLYELLEMERRLLRVLNWNLFVEDETYTKYDRGLRNCPHDIETDWSYSLVSFLEFVLNLKSRLGPWEFELFQSSFGSPPGLGFESTKQQL